MAATQQNATHSRTAHTRLTHDENKRTDAGVAKMKAQFSSCGKRSTKNQSEQLQQVAVGAMGLVCDEFGAHRLAAVAARVPSSKGQSSCIRTP